VLLLPLCAGVVLLLTADPSERDVRALGGPREVAEPARRA